MIRELSNALHLHSPSQNLILPKLWLKSCDIIPMHFWYLNLVFEVWQNLVHCVNFVWPSWTSANVLLWIQLDSFLCELWSGNSLSHITVLRLLLINWFDLAELFSSQKFCQLGVRNSCLPFFCAKTGLLHGVLTIQANPIGCNKLRWLLFLARLAVEKSSFAVGVLYCA